MQGACYGGLLSMMSCNQVIDSVREFGLLQARHEHRVLLYALNMVPVSSTLLSVVLRFRGTGEALSYFCHRSPQLRIAPVELGK
jgi:hypothetical protein